MISLGRDPGANRAKVRRFFCTKDNCAQHVFTERLPNTLARHSRRTCRLSVALDRFTLALGGSAGSRLAEQLGILTNGSTLLRGLRKRASPSSSKPLRVVGIDDWAWRKGQRYGTIFCDLERGTVIDLLPDLAQAMFCLQRQIYAFFAQGSVEPPVGPHVHRIAGGYSASPWIAFGSVAN
jgi:hypothetical protein